MYKSKKVSIIIGTYNEADSIASVINGFFATGFVEEKQGYGYAYMRGLKETTGDLIVMTEADGTFEPNDIHKFLLYSDDFEAVFGTRTSRASIWSGAFMPFPVRLGNWAVAKFLEILHNGPTLTDVGCTYKLISREVLEKLLPLFPLSPGDGKFSPEFMIWTMKKGFIPIEIPVMFKPRVGQSMYTGSILKAAILGLRMIPMIVKYRFKKI